MPYTHLMPEKELSHNSSSDKKLNPIQMNLHKIHLQAGAAVGGPANSENGAIFQQATGVRLHTYPIEN
ncbi:hypothetical protein LZP73_12255 [Shewanella sp. AS16]|uniref:hypothetical protein n=1 Tax=Shewanella sp. AS16 TaxID=2907625 RepID=UPI001F3D64DF|nr:hypothetical protein [Shewanella sp. AS16]MCE9686966.1 hypothetical protein [Shewanella sp. AS16]